MAQPGFIAAMQGAKEALTAASGRMERAKSVAAAVARAGVALDETIVVVDPFIQTSRERATQMGEKRERRKAALKDAMVAAEEGYVRDLQAAVRGLFNSLGLVCVMRVYFLVMGF